MVVALLCYGTEKLSFSQSAALWKPCAKVRSVSLTLLTCVWCSSRTVSYCACIDVCLHTRLMYLCLQKLELLCICTCIAVVKRTIF